MSSEIELPLRDNLLQLDERTDLILRIISAYSPSGRESGVAEIISDYLQGKNLAPQIDPAGNVICEFGRGQRSILLCGHMDTIPGELPVKLEGGRIFGRGACDAKGPLLSLLFAFESLAKASPAVEGRIMFAGVTDEELYSKGLAELIREDYRSDYAIFGEPGGVSKITVGYRGHVSLRLAIVTPETHASAPHLVTNSAELLFEIYSSLKMTLAADNGGSLDKVSIALTEIKSGTAHNIIPGNTEATMDIRVPIGSRTDQIVEKIQNLISGFRDRFRDAEISTEYDEPTEPYRVSLNSPLVRAMNRSILKKGTKPQLITKSGTGDMNTYAKAFGIDAVTYGPGEAKLSHTSEENVSVEEIFSCAEVVKSAIKELVKLDQSTPEPSPKED